MRKNREIKEEIKKLMARLDKVCLNKKRNFMDGLDFRDQIFHQRLQRNLFWMAQDECNGNYSPNMAMIKMRGNRRYHR